MRILLLSPWFPLPAFGGALIRVFETLRHLARRHRVTLLAPIHGAPDTEHLRTLTDLGVEVVTVPVSASNAAQIGRLGRGLFRGQSLLQGLHYDAGLAFELRRLTTLHAYDIVHIEHSFMAPYIASAARHHQTKTVLSMHNIESLRFRREARVGRWGLRRAALTGDDVMFGSWEKRAVRQFDGITAVSPREQAWARDHAPAARVALVANGVDLEWFRPVDRPAATRTIVFSGLMNYPPNVDAVVWFCDTILPLVARRDPDVRFSIVGDKPTRTVLALGRRAHVEVTGRVADIRPYLANAIAAVVPVRSGAGTRLKILEAMAMRRPVVATSLGAEGLDVTPDVDILIGDSPEAFADRVCALLGDAPLADRVGDAGRRLVEKRYDWRICLRNLDRLYETLIGTHNVREPQPFAAVSS